MPVLKLKMLISSVRVIAACAVMGHLSLLISVIFSVILFSACSQSWVMGHLD